VQTRKRFANLKGVAGILLIVVVAAVASYMKPGRNRASPVEGFSAIGTLQSIHSAADIYRKVYSNGYPAGLGVLAGVPGGNRDCDHAQLIDNQLASGVRGSYIFTYRPRPPLSPAAQGCTLPGASGYTLTADPIDFGNPDMRHFFTDETGVIRFEFGKQATAKSPEIE
jgi:type IV pilus assembly protein PilA